MILFIVIWTIQLSASYYHLFNPTANTSDPVTPKKGEDKTDGIYNAVDFISGVSMFSTGIVLALVRLYEPFFQFLIKQFVCKCFGIVIEQDRDGFKTQTLSTFLASSLNVELVHIILKGIKKFSNIRMQDLELDENFSNEYDAQAYRELQEKESYELMRICRLNRIKIKNPEKWDKAKYDDFVENEFVQTDNAKKGPK